MYKLQRVLLKQSLEFRVRVCESKINKAFEAERNGETPIPTVESLIQERAGCLEQLASLYDASAN